LVIARTHFFALAVSVILVLFALELIRRRRLQERYALLWLLVAVSSGVLALSPKAIDGLARLAGIYYPPAALFLLAILFLIVVMVHFSVVISSLSEQNKKLAQEIAILRERGQRPVRSEESGVGEL